MEILSLDVLTNRVNVGSVDDLLMVRLLTKKRILVICLRVVDWRASSEDQLRLEMLKVHAGQA